LAGRYKYRSTALGDEGVTYPLIYRLN
jgi:hypothetical protein